MKKIVGGAVVLVVGLAIVVGIAGSVGLLEGTPLGPMWDSNVRGYGTAKTPQQCADYFKKAVKERDYVVASKYCTAKYAEQLQRGAKGAREMAQKMDDLQYQMKSRGYNTDDTKVYFFQADPFPANIDITIKEEGDSAMATFTFSDLPKVDLFKPYEGWKMDPRMMRVYWWGVRNPVKMVKENGAWRFDFNVEPGLQVAVDRLNQEYKDYYNAYNVLTLEVKNEPTTKENVKSRLKTLIEEAAQ